jgi:hypothetical protein
MRVSEVLSGPGGLRRFAARSMKKGRLIIIAALGYSHIYDYKTDIQS